MGLPLLDAANFERLGGACVEAGRYEFLFTVAPLILVGGTGSPVNPIATLERRCGCHRSRMGGAAAPDAHRSSTERAATPRPLPAREGVRKRKVMRGAAPVALRRNGARQARLGREGALCAGPLPCALRAAITGGIVSPPRA